MNETIKNGTYGMKIPNIPMTKIDALVADLDYCATKVNLSLEDRKEIALCLIALGYVKPHKMEPTRKDYLIAYVNIDPFVLGNRLLTQTVTATNQKEAVDKFRKMYEKEPIIAITLME